MRDTTLRLSRVVAATPAEGPGLRFAVWVQGCSLRCPGCCNPRLFDRRGGHEKSVTALLADLDAARDRVEGVTLLGGEPFEQAAPLARFAEGARERGLGVMAFSGYALDELRTRRDPGVDALLSAVDLLVDGRYDASRPERERRWAGSSNQRFHFLSARYAPGIEVVRAGEVANTVDVRVLTDGTLDWNGWPVSLTASA